MKTWRIDTGAQTLALATDGSIPWVIWWGAPLPMDQDLAALESSTRADLTGAMMDVTPALSLCPEAARGFPGQPGLVLSEADGTPLAPRFAFDSAQEREALALHSRWQGLRLTHRITTAPGGMLALQTRLASDRPVRVHWLAAPVLPGPQDATILTPSGRWIGEFRMTGTPWVPGARVIEARQGRSGHEYPPFALFPGAGATNTRGEVRGLNFGWSGGHRMVAEELPDGRRQIQIGVAMDAETAVGNRFETPPLHAGYSDVGLNGIAVANQRLTASLIDWPDATRPRPVHCNCWEAVYFDHDLISLLEIAEKAAALGAERFVLDDGWFGRRDDDTTSLGDWMIDRRKWPEGLNPLIERVEALGMRFGLWVEPEMVSPDSDLYRAHPDWVLGLPDQVLERHQMVLDMARQEVRDYLFEHLKALLSEYRIDCLKWDHNRLLPVVDAAQTRGLYALLDRLRAEFPEVEIESCASGGGRIDTGILTRTHRVWLSDSNDGLERLRIQHDAALFLPNAVTGSHVGPRDCHTSGRSLSMSFRARVAAQRHLGFEMDLRELTVQETRVLGEVTAWWKAGRDWRMAADVLRLDTAPEITAEMQRSPDGKRFTLFVGVVEAGAQTLPRPVRLTGLDPAARYRVTLINPEDAPKQSRGPVALRSGSLILSGAVLMGQGLVLPWAWPATIWVIDGEKIAADTDTTRAPRGQHMTTKHRLARWHGKPDSDGVTG